MYKTHTSQKKMKDQKLNKYDSVAAY